MTQTSSLLPVMEAFYTLQGEGAYTGNAAYFIRLAGCDVGCHWCDVKESWDAEKHPKKSVEEIVVEAEKFPARIAVITGGEPLMYNLAELTTKLKEKGFRTHIETSGAYPLTGTWDWICVSPKKFKAPLPEVLAKADELKVIVFNNSDFEYAHKNAASVPSKALLLVQPEWDKSEQVLPSIIEFVKNNPAWRISLQTHKFLNIP